MLYTCGLFSQHKKQPLIIQISVASIVEKLSLANTFIAFYYHELRMIFDHGCTVSRSDLDMFMIFFAIFLIWFKYDSYWSWFRYFEAVYNKFCNVLKMFFNFNCKKSSKWIIFLIIMSLNLKTFSFSDTFENFPRRTNKFRFISFNCYRARILKHHHSNRPLQ